MDRYTLHFDGGVKRRYFIVMNDETEITERFMYVGEHWIDVSGNFTTCLEYTRANGTGGSGTWCSPNKCYITDKGQGLGRVKVNVTQAGRYELICNFTATISGGPEVTTTKVVFCVEEPASVAATIGIPMGGVVLITG